jgi:predicted nuclease of restriction endonuclease-like (RecB) superfamily
MYNLIQNTDYKNWLVDLKSTIKQRQIKAVLAVNRELILLYWELGKQIAQKQENAKWGTGFIEQLSKDLKRAFPEMSGFSKSNLFAIKKFYSFYNQHFEFFQQLAGKIQNDSVTFQQIAGEFEIKEINDTIIDLCSKIPWFHNVIIIEKIKDLSQILFYINQTIENNWSRAILIHQIENNLYERQVKTINNFSVTLPKPQSDLANQLMKDPYTFDFLQLTKKYNESDLEKALTHHITDFLLELGKGFSFVGKQYEVNLGDKNYKIDLLFYHLNLRCFVVIELKVVAFEPEFAGKLNFYLNIIDDQLKHSSDNPTIGIIICKTKDNIEAEYALRGIEKPIGISEYELQKLLPENYKSDLPSIEDIEMELNKLNKIQ